jgi:hypothetical protein
VGDHVVVEREGVGHAAQPFFHDTNRGLAPGQGDGRPRRGAVIGPSGAGRNDRDAAQRRRDSSTTRAAGRKGHIRGPDFAVRSLPATPCPS